MINGARPRQSEHTFARRAAGVCGLLALVTVSVGWIGGALAQPDAYSSADDDLSDLGALTANKAWIYNQIGDNLSGILIILLGLGLWRALSPDVLGRIGAGAVMLTGLVVFLEGFFRLDCRGIDSGCTNESWHASAHKMNNRFTVAATIAAPLILAFAFRRIPEWRQWCISPRLDLDVVRVACLPRCALDANGNWTSSADRVTESVSIPRQSVSVLPSSCTCIVSMGPTAENSARLEQSLRAFATAKVETRDEFRDRQLGSLKRVVHIFYALLGLSVLVSMFGVINTIVLSVFERTREIGMLRAVGMTRRQLRRMIRHESTALIGAALGMAIGIFLAGLTSLALSRYGVVFGDPVQVPGGLRRRRDPRRHAGRDPASQGRLEAERPRSTPVRMTARRESSRLMWCNALARRTRGSGWLECAHLLSFGVALVLVDEHERERFG